LQAFFTEFEEKIEKKCLKSEKAIDKKV